MPPFLASMYLGAKMVRLQGLENPECLAQAAHSIREFIDALPAKYDVPVVNYEDLVSRTRKLIRKWESFRSGSAAKREKEWKRFEREMQAFAETSEAVRVTGKERAAAAITRMDPSGKPLPAAIGPLHVAEWQQHREYFVLVCHHREPATADDFDRMLETFEGFLVRTLGLRATEEKSALDRAIAKAEGR